MATGGAFLMLMLWLSQDPSLGNQPHYEMDSQISAPPELIALIPEAASATVSAGYFNSSSEESLTVSGTSGDSSVPVTGTTDGKTSSGTSTVGILKPGKIVITGTETAENSSAAPSAGSENSLEVLQNSLETLGASLEAPTTSGPETSEAAEPTNLGPVTNGSEYVGATTETTGVPVQVISVGTIEDNTGIIGTPVEVATMEVATEDSTPKEEVLLVGDSRYKWQEWSPWHCNCPAGSMSRVRDIAYSVPDVRLDPLQYNVLRFERKVCSYNGCRCDRQAHQCDRLEVTCNEEAAHLCALKDLEFDQQRKRTDFWANVHTGLKNLWHSMKDAFPKNRKEPKALKKRRAAPSLR